MTRTHEGTRERFTPNAPLGSLIPGIPAHLANIPAGSVYTTRNLNSAFPQVLLACAAGQLQFLVAVWGDLFFPDDDVISAFKALIKGGKFLDVMDHNSPDARERVVLTYNGVLEGRGKL